MIKNLVHLLSIYLFGILMLPIAHQIAVMYEKAFKEPSKVNGSVLVYNSSTSLFETTTELTEQTINGGQY